MLPLICIHVPGTRASAIFGLGYFLLPYSIVNHLRSKIVYEQRNIHII